MYNSSISGIFRLFIVISLISLFVGCGGGGGGSSTPGGNTASSPTITSLTPTSGQVGDTVTITGTNFSTTLANNTVSFNGADAVVSSCTSTQIVTNVPVGATSGPIIVAVDGKSVKSSTNFTVNVSLPAFAASGLYDSGYFAFYWAETTAPSFMAVTQALSMSIQ